MTAHLTSEGETLSQIAGALLAEVIPGATLPVIPGGVIHACRNAPPQGTPSQSVHCAAPNQPRRHNPIGDSHPNSRTRVGRQGSLTYRERWSTLAAPARSGPSSHWVSRSPRGERLSDLQGGGLGWWALLFAAERSSLGWETAAATPQR